MYRNILVPLDGSKRAEAILPHVEEMARLYKAKIVFMQVVEMPAVLMGHGIPDLSLQQKEFEALTEQGEIYLKSVEGEFHEKGLRAGYRLAHGPVVDAVIKTAEAVQADLIALASHGRSGLSQVFYGSVAAGVLHRADRPLLIIRSLE